MATTGLDPAELHEALQHPLLRLLDERARNALAQSARRALYRARRPVFRADEVPDSVAFILSGSVRICHASLSGAERVSGIVSAPAVVGANEALTRDHSDAVQTLAPAVVVHVPVDLFRWFVENEPAFAVGLCMAQARLARLTAKTERSITFDRLSCRVARLLLQYADAIGQPSAAGIVLSQPLSQECLARDLGISRKALNQALKPFKAVGAIAKQNARYIIRNPSELAAQAT